MKSQQIYSMCVAETVLRRSLTLAVFIQAACFLLHQQHVMIDFGGEGQHS